MHKGNPKKTIPGIRGGFMFTVSNGRCISQAPGGEKEALWGVPSLTHVHMGGSLPKMWLISE